MTTSDGPQSFPYKSSLFILKEWCWSHTITSIQETWVQPLGRLDPLGKEMATHSSILAWRTPWTEKPGRLHSPWGCKELDMTERLTQYL